MAIAEVYIDPSIAADSGTGTSGDPYGDLQYALDTHSTSGGPWRFNIKAGTAEVMTAIADLSRWTASAANRIIFEGYTSSAGDGGVGDINGNNGNFSLFPARHYLAYRNLKLRNTGTADILPGLLATSHIDSCELSDTSADGVGGTTVNGRVWNCNFHDIGTFGVSDTNAEVMYCYFKNGTTNKFTSAINACDGGGTGPAVIAHNIFSLDSSSNGINLNSFYGVIAHNSILSSSGTGAGITGAGFSHDIINNLIEGFSGVGGNGIEVTGSNFIDLYGHNAIENCTTEYSVACEIWVALGDNESLGATPFDKSGADTFSNRFTYFAPADTGNVRGGAYPTGARRDKGAVQHADPAGGGGILINPGTTGGVAG